MKMSPRLVPGLGLAGPVLLLRAPGPMAGGKKPVHHQPSPWLAKQGLHKPPVALPVIQSRLPGAFWGACVCICVHTRVCLCAQVCLVFSFLRL